MNILVVVDARDMGRREAQETPRQRYLKSKIRYYSNRRRFALLWMLRTEDKELAERFRQEIKLADEAVRDASEALFGPSAMMQ